MMMIDVPVTATVLVAEDDSIVATDLKESLEEMGYEVPTVVGTGKDALAQAREIVPDLVLMDVRMPGPMDGVQAAQRISDELQIPVVYLSAYSDDVTLNRAKQTHPFGYLVKPFDPRELKTAVEIAIYRHQAERMVQESRKRYRRLFENDISGNFVSTPDGKILECNRAFAEMLGFESVDECLDAEVVNFFPEESVREELVDELRRKGRINNTRFTLLRRDGEPIRVLEYARGEFDAHGRLIRIHGHMVDVTREERAREQLRLTSRMEAVGRLAAGVAHDFNNFLTAIRGAVDLVLRSEDLSEEAEDDLHSALRSCDRAAGVVQELLAASGESDGPRGVVDLDRVVAGMEDLLDRLIGERVELEMEVADRPLRVRASPSRLEQVVLNLVVNARDAVGDHEPGRIGVRVEAVDPRDVPSGDQVVEGRWARISVSDTGSGMSDETLERIFDPFFTTKGPDAGHGLGLASVFGIVRDHDGWIDVESVEAEGSIFRVHLPLLDEALEDGGD